MVAGQRVADRCSRTSGMPAVPSRKEGRVERGLAAFSQRDPGCFEIFLRTLGNPKCDFYWTIPANSPQRRASDRLGISTCPRTASDGRALA